MFYNALQKDGYRVPGVYDPQEKRLMGIIFRPSVWQANTVYYKYSDDSFNIVIPTVFTGLYYGVNAPGKSGATEPVWGYVDGEETTDGTTGLVWTAKEYNLMPPEENISSVTYECTNGVTVSSTTNTDSSCQFMIDVLPTAAVTAGEFKITAHVVKSNIERIDATLVFKVGNR